jgi:hypothetical protein
MISAQGGKSADLFRTSRRRTGIAISARESEGLESIDFKKKIISRW